MPMLQPGLPTLPMRSCRKTPHDLSSWSAALELQKACGEVCLVGLVCVPILGVLSALPYAMGVASWALYASRGLLYLLVCVSEAIFAARWWRGRGAAGQRYWTPLQTFAALRTVAEFWSSGYMEASLAAALVAPFALPSGGVHLGERLCVLTSLANLAMLCPSRCVGLLLLCEALRPTYGLKANSRAVGYSSKHRSAAEYIRDVRGYVAEHGRPPSSSSSLVGTAEYKLRQNMQKQVKKGLFRYRSIHRLCLCHSIHRLCACHCS